MRLSRPPLARREPTPPDWVAANPTRIAARAARAAARPSGGWVVAGATPRRRDGPRSIEVDGHPLVLWPGGGGPAVAPDVCPHMGARLGAGRTDDGCLVCPWHGLRLGPAGHAWWRCLPVHDDGVLTWVRLPLPDGSPEESMEAPSIPKRPDGALTAVVERAARSEVRDIVENRLDPWHGRHYHPYAFADLVVVDEDDDSITCDVRYRVAGPVCADVRARFDAPEAGTVRMEIVDGLGAGSVVETHATAAGPGRCRVIEAVFAVSDRVPDLARRRFAPLLARSLAVAAGRLWRDDVAYAERRYALRQGEVNGWPLAHDGSR